MTTEYRVGCGIADITGEVAECGMLGYGVATQQTAGLHNRLRARAFIVADSGDRRVLLVVCELPLMFDSVHREVLRRLGSTHGGRYALDNVMLTVTHTHCGPGGYSDHWLYNSNTGGFRPQTFEAVVDGIIAAVEHAHADLADADLSIATGALHDASVNRSPTAFARNPATDRAQFPDGIDPQTTLLRIERHGRLVGAVNWFATHGTSMTNRNRLISSDNKGYAAYRRERLDAHVDYLAGGSPELVAAFAQTNSADMSPNLHRQPGSGPTEDEFDNTRIIGDRQASAAARLTTEPGRGVSGGLDTRMAYVDLADFVVEPEFTGDRRRHRTGPLLAGAAALAGTDEGPGPLHPLVRQGRNGVIDGVVRHVVYRLSPRLRDSHAPKGVLAPGRHLNSLAPLMAEAGLVQLLRIGQLYLIGIPAEVTITAGLRLRRAVAAIVGAELADVLVAGYSNGYLHYVTTPEEYDEQRYEGGSTMFGRWQLPALQQVVAGLAVCMRDGRPAAGAEVPAFSSRQWRSRRRPMVDEPVDGCRFGDVLQAPAARYGAGATVRAVFVGAYPNNDLRHGDSYLRVESERNGGGWGVVADDGDWSTTFRWRRAGRRRFRRRVSVATVTWTVPAGTPAGRYRLRYDGDARGADGRLRAFSGVTGAFEVVGRET